MSFRERKFTVYSGTVLENFKQCAYRIDDSRFYRKSGGRFDYPEGVYFTPNIGEAAWWALHSAKELLHRDWFEQEELSLSDLSRRRNDRHTPIIMSGQVSMPRRIFHFVPVNDFPVESLLVLKPDVNWDDLYGSRNSELPDFFHQVDLQDILRQA